MQKKTKNSALRNNNSGFSQRQLRVGEEIKHILAFIFLEEHFYDADLKDISITISQVTVSPDFRNATVYVFPLAGKADENFVDQLNLLASNFGRMLAKKIKLRYTPKLRFAIDDSFIQADKIEKLIEQTKLN